MMKLEFSNKYSVMLYGFYSTKKKARSAWEKGVRRYAEQLFSDLEEYIVYNDSFPGSEKELEKALLNGAKDWVEFSYGGCSFIDDRSIACRLCNDTELKKTDYGRKRPNKKENWLDVQARALHQACNILKRLYVESEGQKR